MTARAAMAFLAGVLMLLLMSFSVGTPEPGTEHKVILEDVKFVPNRVKVAKGDTIRFTNKDAFEHDVFIVRAVNTSLIVVDATKLAPAADTVVIIEEDGVFNLFCTIHGGMEGMITTKESFEPSEAERAKYEVMKPPLPKIAKDGEALFWEKAQCFRCHRVDDRGDGERGPDLKNIGLRARSRAQDLGLSSGTEYIVQSILHPSVVIVQGYSNDMATVYQPPIDLGAEEIKAIVAYLQSLGGDVDTWSISISESELDSQPVYNPFVGGDAEEGAEVFAMMGCWACHSVPGGRSAVTAGPDISSIGAFRTWAWLARSVIDPNDEVGTNWHLADVDLVSGKSVSGFVRTNSSEELSLLVRPGRIETIPRDQVESVELSELSKMPTNYGELMTVQQLNDLIAYMQSLRGESAEDG